MNILISLAVLFPQDSPVDIPKAELPKKAACVVCSSMGESHGEERPAAGVKYKGKAYFFCSSGEVKTFKADPEGYLPPTLPRPMPAFKMADLAGRFWSAESFPDKVILVDFMASWCKPCHEIKPRLDKLRAELNPKGFEVLSVSIDEKRGDLDKYLAKNKYSNPVFHDVTQTWAAWKVKAIPALFLVKNGQVVHQWVGKPKKDELESVVRSCFDK